MLLTAGAVRDIAKPREEVVLQPLLVLELRADRHEHVHADEVVDILGEEVRLAGAVRHDRCPEESPEEDQVEAQPLVLERCGVSLPLGESDVSVQVCFVRDAPHRVFDPAGLLFCARFRSDNFRIVVGAARLRTCFFLRHGYRRDACCLSPAARRDANQRRISSMRMVGGSSEDVRWMAPGAAACCWQVRA
eukprot:SAG31_NODE_3107_length_4667_cov_4.409807_2_plen_191_part_00